MSIKSFSDFLTEDTKEAAFVFGRFNPPTIGHEKLFDKLKSQARSGVYRIYSSKSVDPKKNPLLFKDKIKFLRKMFPKHARSVMADKDVRNVLDVAVKLYEQGFTKVTMVAGSDRVKEFDILLNKYNGQKAKHGFYNFEGAINVVSAGERDPDAEGATGMSASKMRDAAQQNKLHIFAKGLPSNFYPTDLFNAVRKGMGLKMESLRQHVELPPVSETREEYIEGSLYQVGDIVRIKESQDIGEIILCGSNYVMVESESVKKRYWLESVELFEEGGAGDWGTVKGLKRYLKDTPGQKHFKEKMGPQDPDIKDRKGTQPKGYYAKDASGKEMAKSTKAKRAAHFKKLSTKPAPGDATAKTKPSQHTKKFKQMYGEWAEHLTFEDFMIDESNTESALKKKADKSGMPLGILRKVFDRGVAAWKSGHRPGTTAVQWGLARVNSFVTKSKGTWGKADKDLAAKV
jgi:hypothetical protein